MLFRIKRGLAGYVSYLAACEMNSAFSEYVLYEPILRILSARGYDVQCECECPGIKQPRTGDKKRIDFVAQGHGVRLALEVKWMKSARLDVTKDLEKLRAFQTHFPASFSFLCVFGRAGFVEPLLGIEGPFSERGSVVVADFSITRYACRIYQLDQA